MASIRGGFTAVVEWTGANYSAYLPDVPGCVATGKTLDDVRENIGAALRIHLADFNADQAADLKPSAIMISVPVSEPVEE